ncbi:MAG: phosphotransferase [Acidimicrobiia bacterium]
MSSEDLGDLANYHTLDERGVPDVVVELAEGRSFELMWRNEIGGLTFEAEDVYIKWNPRSSGVDLIRERDRLEWLSPRHPAPSVVSFGSDDDAEWLVTKTLPGGHAVGDEWRARRSEAIAAIAKGLRVLHAVPIDDLPQDWVVDSWVTKEPQSLGERPDIDGPVLVHGDACAPNTLISEQGEWTGNVDFGDLSAGDRWADLAIASLSLDWNFGEGHQAEFFEAYGVDPDDRRIAYYRDLWHLEA